MYRMILWALVLSCSVVFAACSNPEARIMTDEEDDVVDSQGAGAAAWDRLIEGAVKKILQQQSASPSAFGKITVAYFGVENKSSEDLGDWKAQVFQLVDTSINQSGRYATISDRFVKRALEENNQNPDDLFLPKHRRTFVATLEKTGNPVQFLLYSTITSGSSRNSTTKQRNYVFTLEIVDTVSGRNDKVSERIRKAFER